MTVPREVPLPTALADATEKLDGTGRVVVVELGAGGITTYRLDRDDVGFLRCRGRNVPWPVLLGGRTSWDSGDAEGERAVLRAAGDLSGAVVFFVCPLPDGSPTDTAIAWLRKARPEARIYTADAVVVADLIRAAMANDPLRWPYDLVLLRAHPDGRLELTAEQLFPFGARRGKLVRRELRCEPSDAKGVAFAVVSWQDRDPVLVSIQAARVPAGRHELTAELRRPGLVRMSIRGVPELTEDERDWAELVSAVPLRLASPSGPMHLICAVETCGAPAKVEERLGRIRQMITTLSSELPDRLDVSLVAYGAHSYDARDPDPPIDVAAWTASPVRALESLRRLEDAGADARGYPDAARLEDMLAEVDRRLGSAATGRTALLTVGERPPHPPRVESEILPCPARHDWSQLLRRLENRPGMTLGAICDRPGERAGRAWSRLGGGAPAHLEAVDVRTLAARMGLRRPPDQLIPFPLTVD
ncbi:hypothetical protein N5079_14650 [Planotetraspora sp. A-T 1434]|uniref:hypothetical protein n=1 Tax=Planotetraspora sp. A-T 1434 TaxID=2979219 RepID=UPI0021BE7DF1|nr:hypothetical protein [Planotetraspora sp. A-T 1434]MCT9931457.1 hypothetical protein [Planotetraspora sp. A-T 1434]